MDSLDLLEYWLPKLQEEVYQEEDGTIRRASELEKVKRDLEIMRFIKPFISSVVAQDDYRGFFGYLVPAAEVGYTNRGIFNEIEEWLSEPVFLPEELKCMNRDIEELEQTIKEPKEALYNLYYLALHNSRPHTYGAYKIEHCYKLLNARISSLKGVYNDEKKSTPIKQLFHDNRRAWTSLVRWVYVLQRDKPTAKWIEGVNPENILVGDVIKFQDKFWGARNCGKKTWKYIRDTINEFVGEEVIKI